MCMHKMLCRTSGSLLPAISIQRLGGPAITTQPARAAPRVCAACCRQFKAITAQHLPAATQVPSSRDIVRTASAVAEMAPASTARSLEVTFQSFAAPSTPVRLGFGCSDASQF